MREGKNPLFPPRMMVLCPYSPHWCYCVKLGTLDQGHPGPKWITFSSPGLGSGPHVFMVGPEDKGISLTCTGKGRFPQPEVQWTDARGEKIPTLSEDETQDDDGLFQIEASLIVRDSSKTSVLLHEESLLWTRAGGNHFYPRSVLLIWGTG